MIWGGAICSSAVPPRAPCSATLVLIALRSSCFQLLSSFIKNGLWSICLIYLSLLFQWIMVDQGAMMFSMVLVPLYSTLGAEGMNHILQQSKLTSIIVLLIVQGSTTTLPFGAFIEYVTSALG